MSDINNKLFKYSKMQLTNIKQIKPDINGDGNWVDEFYQIVQDFVHKDDDAKINYYKEFELNGRKCNLNDILTSKNAGKVIITKKEFLSYFIDNMVSSISEVLQNLDKEVINNIMSTLFEYYYNFADLSWDKETYYSGKVIEVNNHIAGEKENVYFNFQTAEEYGIKGGNGYYIEIDIKTFVLKFLELVEQATADI